MMTNLEKGTLVKLFNRGGYILDFTTPDFDAFTLDSVGVPLCSIIIIAIFFFLHISRS